MLAALALALVFALDGRWTLSAVAGAAAALGRPEATSSPSRSRAIAIGRARASGRVAGGRAIGAAFAPVASVATFPLYLGWALDNVVCLEPRPACVGTSVLAPDGIVHAFQQLHEPGSTPWLWRDVGFCLIYLGLLASARRVGISWPWLVASTALLPAPTHERDIPIRCTHPASACAPCLLGAAALARRPVRSSAGSRSLSGAAGGRDDDDSACKPLTPCRTGAQPSACPHTTSARTSSRCCARSVTPGVRVLVIDDNSPDGTGELADRLAQELDYVDVLHRPS